MDKTGLLFAVLRAFTQAVHSEVTIELVGDAHEALEENLRARLRLNAESCEALLSGIEQ